MQKVLLIEDDPMLVDIYTTKLKSAGFETVSLDNTDKVFEVIDEEQPDIILLDIVLPHVDGWEILRSIKQRGMQKPAKIIILSNLGQKEDIEKGMSLGADKYLIKAHYTPSEVVEEITKVIGAAPASPEEGGGPQSASAP